jgi:hypothetical protein
MMSLKLSSNGTFVMIMAAMIEVQSRKGIKNFVGGPNGQKAMRLARE